MIKLVSIAMVLLFSSCTWVRYEDKTAGIVYTRRTMLSQRSVTSFTASVSPHGQRTITMGPHTDDTGKTVSEIATAIAPLIQKAILP